MSNLAHNHSDNPRQCLAVNLRTLMRHHGIGINRLAQDLSLPIMTIRRLISGETEDPRIHTLKLFADYFEVSIDTLIHQCLDCRSQTLKTKPQHVPILDWEMVERARDIRTLDLTDWERWQAISRKLDNKLGDHTFALESRPAMYPRYPKNTLFIIDPDVEPIDGDTVLVRLDNGEIVLRELLIDSTQKQLRSLDTEQTLLALKPDKHTILGVDVLTIFFKRKLRDE